MLNGVFFGLNPDSEAPTSVNIGEHDGEGVFVGVTDDFVLEVVDEVFMHLVKDLLGIHQRKFK